MSREDSVNPNFKDNFSYFAAFVAILIGLGTFRDFAESHSLELFNFSLSYLQISIPFIALMSLAMWVGALAMISRNYNFSLFPLTRILENTSNFFAILGLLSPVLIPVGLLVTWLSDVLSTANFSLSRLSNVLTSLATIFIGVLALQLTKARSQALHEQYTDDFYRELRRFEAKIEKTSKQADALDVLQLYNKLLSLSKNVLRLRGYGATGLNPRYMSKMLVALGIWDEGDMAAMEDARAVRNLIAHSDNTPSRRSIKKAVEILNELIEKLGDEVIKQDDGDKS